MPNLSQLKRQRMLGFLDKIRGEHTDDESRIAIHEIETELTNRKYGLIWEEHEERVESEMREAVPVFTEVADKEIISDASLPYNFLLEGDNLHSLKLLQKTHMGRVDLIYIDPPYNTESKDFQYDDLYVESSDSFRHSKWISFMHERLAAARGLLSEDGCILISINENELFVLKLLCDEIFGEEHYLTTFSIRVRHEDRILKGDKDFHEVTEFLLMYRKSFAFKPKKRAAGNTSMDDYQYKVIEKTSAPQLVEMGGKQVAVFKPGEYEVVKTGPCRDGLKAVNIRGSIKEGNSSGRFFMKYLEGRMESERGYLYKVFDMGADGLGYRYFSIPRGGRVNGDYYQGIPAVSPEVKEIPYANYLDFEADFNSVGYEGGVVFRNGKKPLSFLEFCFEIANLKEKKEGIVLDFFAGSGTTGHALLKLNEDGGRRTAILCSNNEVGPKKEDAFKKMHHVDGGQFMAMKQNHDQAWLSYCEENGICSSVAYPRMCNAIKGYLKRKIYMEGLPANLKYYKTGFIPKTSDDPAYSVAQELLKHTAEMVQLAHGVKLDGARYILVMSDEEADRVFAGPDKLGSCKALYISASVLLTGEQQKTLSQRDIDVHVVPDCYFEAELLEVGER